MWNLSLGACLGLAMGANDGGNLFGTAVATRVLRFHIAAFLAGVAVILGATLQGEAAIATIEKISFGGHGATLIILMCSSFTIIMMTWIKLPISTSQALMGAIMGVTISMGGDQVNMTEILHTLRKVILCWVLTPIGASLISIILYYILGFILNLLHISLLTRDNIIRSGLIVVGCYCSYAFGMNNIANVVGVYRGQYDISNQWLAFLGGLSIALGIWIFGKGLMKTIGAGLIRLDGFTALVVVLAEAITLHFFGVLGVPVSASQAVVGGILGVGFVRGAEAIQLNLLKNIFIGWFVTPLMSFILAAAGYGLLTPAS